MIDSERLLRSALIEEGKFLSVQQALEWINDRKSEVRININKTNLASIDQWKYEQEKGHIEHISGKFFKIEGIKATIEDINGYKKSWCQPIINQPEVGFLGCITKEFDGVLYFLVQAKIEPGNSNLVQISPTLQATRSNYTRAHKGKSPKYLEYFDGSKKSQIIIDQLQSEQGARFLRKRNRNIIVEITDEIEEHDEFKWLTLGQIKKLTEYDNVVNMDLRTVISAIPFHKASSQSLKEIKNDLFAKSLIKTNYRKHSLVEITSWLTNLKSITDLKIEKVKLDQLEDWDLSEKKLSHKGNLYFDVLWVDVEIMHREVAKWNQPILAPSGLGIIAFITKEINGILHFLVQAEIECGNCDLYEIGPTISCVPNNHPTKRPRYLDLVLNASPENILYCAIQSEEGGRFYHEENKNIIVKVNEEFNEDVPDNYKWVTYRQLLELVQFNNVLNIGARSLLSAINLTKQMN